MKEKPILATSPWCGTCDILKMQLNELNAIYELKDLTGDPEFFKERKIRSIPTLIDGETIIHGAAQILNYFKQ